MSSPAVKSTEVYECINVFTLTLWCQHHPVLKFATSFHCGVAIEPAGIAAALMKNQQYRRFSNFFFSVFIFSYLFVFLFFLLFCHTYRHWGLLLSPLSRLTKQRVWKHAGISWFLFTNFYFDLASCEFSGLFVYGIFSSYFIFC